jgi:ABC-type bacteriocin/lantibiotic exporter with double-glycine peptidase domain
LKIRHVYQRTTTDCGLACVAMVAGRRHREVLNAAVEEFGYPEDGPFSTSLRQLRALLAHFDIESSRPQQFVDFARLRSPTILLINYEPPRTHGHYAVFERRNAGSARVLDPGWWLKHPIRTQLTRIKVARYVTLRHE